MRVFKLVNLTFERKIFQVNFKFEGIQKPSKNKH